MRTSDDIEKLAEALAQAQGQINTAKMGGVNPHFKSKYATLNNIWEACRQPLSANGLAIIQMPSSSEGQLVLTTRLFHSSGQWVEDEIHLQPAKDNIQALGSALTYARRYALSAIVGITVDEDDDAETAVSIGSNKSASKQTNGKATMNPAKLLGRLNEVDGAPGYYDNAQHLYNALKKVMDTFEWPNPDDTASWREAFKMAIEHAQGNKETGPSPMDEIEATAEADK